MYIRSLVTYAVVAFTLTALGQPATASIHEYAVEVSATVQESSPRIDLEWPDDLTTDQYYVFKKELADTTWSSPLAVLPGTSISFSDPDVQVATKMLRL